MPSGMTADIYEGKDVSLRDYLMTVGRGMGFAILQRDDDFSEPVKVTEAEADTRYHDGCLRDAEALLMELPSLSVEDAQARADAEYAEKLRTWEEYRDKKIVLRYRYEEMLKAVEGWNPPASVPSVKDHALKYLRESIDFDCSHAGQPPSRQTGAEWIAAKRTCAERDLKYHSEKRAEAIARTKERNAVIREFLASLPEAVTA